MPESEEKKPDSTEEKASSRKSIDEELRSIWDQDNDEPKEPEKEEVKEPEKEAEKLPEEKKPDELPEEPTDQAERSRLGHRVKTIEELLAKQNEILEALANKDKTPEKSEEPVEVEDEEIQEEIEKQKRINAYLNKQQLAYSNKFVEQLFKEQKANDVDKDTHDAVIKLMDEDTGGKIYNRRYTGTPSIDASLGYSKALAAVLKAKSQGKILPFKQDTPPDKPSLPDKGDERKASDIEIDDNTQGLMNHWGYKAEDIEAHLGGKKIKTKGK